MRLQLSILQGETDGGPAAGETMFKAEKDKKLKCLFILDSERDESYPDWPAIVEFATLTEKQKTMLGAIFPDGKIWMVPPGTPADRKQFLMDSFAKVFANKAFQEAVKKTTGDWPGVDTAKRVIDMANGVKKSKADMAAYGELIKKVREVANLSAWEAGASEHQETKRDGIRL